jgi:hypothetical protein
MLKKLFVIAAGLAISAPVLADHGHGYNKHNKHYWKHHYYQPRPVVVMPPPRVYYAPPRPVYVAPPAPVYYTPPPPVVYPVPQSGVSIRFHFPL